MKVQSISNATYSNKNFGMSASTTNKVVKKVVAKTVPDTQPIPQPVKKLFASIKRLFSEQHTTPNTSKASQSTSQTAIKRMTPKQHTASLKSVAQEAEDVIKKYQDMTLLDKDGNDLGRLNDQVAASLSEAARAGAALNKRGVIDLDKPLKEPKILARIPQSPTDISCGDGKFCRLSPGGERLIYDDGAIVEQGPLGPYVSHFPEMLEKHKGETEICTEARFHFYPKSEDEQIPIEEVYPRALRIMKLFHEMEESGLLEKACYNGPL